MTKEVFNIKGEVVSGKDPDDKWYNLSLSTWLLIGGVLVFNIGCFLSPNLIDDIFRLLDVRLWHTWYFLVLAVILCFSVK